MAAIQTASSTKLLKLYSTSGVTVAGWEFLSILYPHLLLLSNREVETEDIVTIVSECVLAYSDMGREQIRSLKEDSTGLKYRPITPEELVENVVYAIMIAVEAIMILTNNSWSVIKEMVNTVAVGYLPKGVYNRLRDNYRYLLDDDQNTEIDL